MTFVRESEDRRNQRLVAAWQLLTEVSPGASGKDRALNYLHANEERVPHIQFPLPLIDLSFERHGAPVYLQDVDIYDERFDKGADFRMASFAGAVLRDADLRKSAFFQACLYKTELTKAKLTGSSFIGADLRQALLSEAVLTDVVLKDADLSGAHMRQSIGLTQEQLDQAYYCKDYGRPNLPEGLQPPPSKICRTDVRSNAQGCLWSRVDSRRK